MKKISFILAIAILVTSFGCNKSDQTDNSTNKLVGKWELTYNKISYYNANDILLQTDEYDETDIDDPNILEFKTNGDFISTDPDPDNEPEIYEGKWSIQNKNELLLEDETHQFLYHILNLNQSFLEITITETGNIPYDDDNGNEKFAAKAVYILKFKRI